ncbi:uncharacterized protein [Erythrolamprus reginae]|uniref:uncharacterized protein n=1 Tax=Erythrolamprus reginae TaxID=121349 RepID=UPI00396CF6FF
MGRSRITEGVVSFCELEDFFFHYKIPWAYLNLSKFLLSQCTLHGVVLEGKLDATTGPKSHVICTIGCSYICLYYISVHPFFSFCGLIVICFSLFIRPLQRWTTVEKLDLMPPPLAVEAPPAPPDLPPAAPAVSGLATPDLAPAPATPDFGLAPAPATPGPAAPALAIASAVTPASSPSPKPYKNASSKKLCCFKIPRLGRQKK